jgi:hypothetical protein
VVTEARPFTYLWNPPNNELSASQELVAETVALDLDADFLLTGIYLTLWTGAFQIQILDSFDYALMSGYMNSKALSTSAGYPSALGVGHVFAAGGTIKINIQDLSGAPNPLQLAFVGEKLFRVNTEQGGRRR